MGATMGLRGDTLQIREEESPPTAGPRGKSGGRIFGWTGQIDTSRIHGKGVAARCTRPQDGGDSSGTFHDYTTAYRYYGGGPSWIRHK